MPQEEGWRQGSVLVRITGSSGHIENTDLGVSMGREESIHEELTGRHVDSRPGSVGTRKREREGERERERERETHWI